jgi:hypothetical protein
MACEEKEKTGVLEACVSKGQRLVDLVEYSKDSIVSKTILDWEKAGISMEENESTRK